MCHAESRFGATYVLVIVKASLVDINKVELERCEQRAAHQSSETSGESEGTPSVFPKAAGR